MADTSAPVAGTERPNILLLMTDQQRGDCLGLEGAHPVQTPALDYIGASGTRFASAYSACPICVPARRTLMSGQRPSTQGTVGNYGTWLDAPTLAECLRDAGYQTHLAGKLHLWPRRKSYGFEGMDWADGPGVGPEGTKSDYLRWLDREGVGGWRDWQLHGVEGESPYVRPWHMEERYHHANWTTSMAIDFLERRDVTRPFFLKVSYFHPHPPLTPPPVYYERYLNMDLPQPPVGEWARLFDAPVRGRRFQWTRQCLDPQILHQYRAAYYGAINHVDDQIQRLFNALRHQPHLSLENTLVVFVSDHGEMLGDHQWHRKMVPYEGSARIPFLLRLPDPLQVEPQPVVDEVVELMDVMPTILDVAGAPIPETVEGRSVLPLVRGEKPAWREYLHGEIHDSQWQNSGMHYLTDGKRKYIWYPAWGREQFFDLEADPGEMHELSEDPNRRTEIARWRKRLIGELEGRPEGFVRDGSLVTLDGPTPPFLPDHEAAPRPRSYI